MQVALKRLFDVVVSSVLLLILAPLMLITILLIRITSEGPAVFLQQRVGREGRLFTIFKFRTMRLNAPDLRHEDNSTYNAEDDPRVTKVGKILRKTSADELPQLLNVLYGDMSLVGPRPELPEGPKEYTERQFARLRVRPGMTGLAAIEGRNNLPVCERRDLDAAYATNWSLGLDLQILLRTIPAVLARRGIHRAASPESMASSIGGRR